MASILLIDDDDMLRKLLADTLARAGHNVVQAGDGAQGMDLFRATPIDLVVTDLIMPVQEGVETILQLRHEAPHLPIIAMSGGVSNAPLYLEIATKVGAQCVLPKPFTPRELIAAVDELLTKSRRRS